MKPTIGKIIKQRREVLGYTQVSLALAVGCSQTTISSIEQGMSVPSSSLLFRIALTLGVDEKKILQEALGRPLDAEEHKSAIIREYLRLLRWEDRK